MKHTHILLALLFVHQATFAEDPSPPTTTICQPDKLIAAEKFDKPEAFTSAKQPGTDGWRGGIGT